MHCVLRRSTGENGATHTACRNAAQKLGWDIEPQNIALTNGSQSRFSTYLICLPDAVPMVGSKNAVPAGTGIHWLR